jgi:hypothetical protein
MGSIVKSTEYHVMKIKNHCHFGNGFFDDDVCLKLRIRPLIFRSKGGQEHRSQE